MTTNENASVGKLADAIRNMGSSNEGARSKIGTLRTLFAEIEYAQSIGYSLEDILAKMKENGFEIPLAQFKNAMTAIRKERGLVRQKRTRRVVNTLVNTMLPAAEKITLPGPAEVPQDEGIVDVFAKQAEREAKKEVEAKRPKIPRR